MEFIIILAVIAVAVWYFVFRDKKVVQESISEAPYKVEEPVAPKTYGAPSWITTSAPSAEPVKTEAPVVEVAPAVETSPATPAKATKAKSPAKPKAAARTAKPKAPAKAKAPAKTAAKKPKMTVAK